MKDGWFSDGKLARFVRLAKRLHPSLVHRLYEANFVVYNIEITFSIIRISYLCCCELARGCDINFVVIGRIFVAITLALA